MKKNLRKDLFKFVHNFTKISKNLIRYRSENNFVKISK